ncbi:protein of unknown function [Legionella micdadei]|uniref:Uncharacterized protein n=1 Tax=Legionella micdadei TaxID=451 RepID=A0A098GH09_LEGMI|nr:protein of unknown function [Legionella micdadei]
MIFNGGILMGSSYLPGDSSLTPGTTSHFNGRAVSSNLTIRHVYEKFNNLFPYARNDVTFLKGQTC